ncbi:hypothetical protein ANCCAN_26860 [Ancylostoma caninum]|uniref:Uncharacterized protein n=1 Tax=Ancylostoma caninum TaxID=29170 RepID=A0A368F962_ANCCA|nr:hypothetical protein ANCCAN_26860 [Ancylostoma caninum]
MHLTSVAHSSQDLWICLRIITAVFQYHERRAYFRSPCQGQRWPKRFLPVISSMLPRFRDMFSSVVPIRVLNAMQIYESRKAELVNIETGRIRDSTQQMNGTGFPQIQSTRMNAVQVVVDQATVAVPILCKLLLP